MSDLSKLDQAYLEFWAIAEEIDIDSIGYEMDTGNKVGGSGYLNNKKRKKYSNKKYALRKGIHDLSYRVFKAYYEELNN